MEQPDRNGVCPSRSQNPVSPICCMAPAGDATVLGLVSSPVERTGSCPTFEEPGWLSKTVSEVHEIWSLDLWEVIASGHFREQGKKFLCRSS